MGVLHRLAERQGVPDNGVAADAFGQLERLLGASASYTGPNADPISTSQPLHDPASTCRICTEPPRSTAAAGLAPTGRRGAGSAIRPVLRILRHNVSTILLRSLDVEIPSVGARAGVGRTAIWPELDYPDFLALGELAPDADAATEGVGVRRSSSISICPASTPVRIARAAVSNSAILGLVNV